MPRRPQVKPPISSSAPEDATLSLKLDKQAQDIQAIAQYLVERDQITATSFADVFKIAKGNRNG